jgi:hypothetical protein
VVFYFIWIGVLAGTFIAATACASMTEPNTPAGMVAFASVQDRFDYG